MPLDADYSAARFTFHCLYKLVKILPGNPEVMAQAIDGLVVQAVDAQMVGPADRCHEGVGLQVHLLGRKQPGAVMGQAACMADILMQAAAEHHIDQLGSAANAQQGDFALQCDLNPVDLQTVALPVDSHALIDVTAIVFGADIIATADHQPVECFRCGLCVANR